MQKRIGVIGGGEGVGALIVAALQERGVMAERVPEQRVVLDQQAVQGMSVQQVNRLAQQLRVAVGPPRQVAITPTTTPKTVADLLNIEQAREKQHRKQLKRLANALKSHKR